MFDALKRVPKQIWLICALLAALRALPFALTYFAAAANGTEPIPVGYNPKDWLSYVAFIRQADWLMANPFATEAQDGRFILLFHTLLGKFSALTGSDPFVVLELSRIPLIFLFFYLLWRLLCAVLPDIRQRILCAWLVAFSGGLEWTVSWASAYFPERIATVIGQDTWHLQGWNSFAAFYNPLWIAALALTLPILRPILQPEAATGRDRLTVGLGTLLLCFVHPYSAILVVAVFCMRPLLEWSLQRPNCWGNSASLGPPLALALTIAAAISRWQMQDPIFKLASGSAWGPQDLPVFWYPLTLGALAVFALRGWRTWLDAAHPWRYGIGAWTVAVALLHSSPLLNGYHYVFYLHLPLCIVASGAIAAAYDRCRELTLPSLRIAALSIALFASSLSVSVVSVTEANSKSRVPSDYLRTIEYLATQIPGNVMAPPDLGNLIPAYTPHRVFSGQWFLTPMFEARNRAYWTFIEDPAAHGAELAALIEMQRIRYLVVPTEYSAALQTALQGAISRSDAQGGMTILHIARR